MYPTYQEIMKVSQDTTLTPSQKMHEIFKNSKTEPLQEWLDKRLELFGQDLVDPVDPSVKIDQAEVVEVNADGQILVFRYPDNTYHYIDAGSYVEIEGIDHIAVDSIDDDSIKSYFQDLLVTDDSPLVFYRGFWVDKDLQEFFLNSYPN
jgi:hypothetical protein